MKNILIFLSIFTVICMAAYDVKGRFGELEEVAANTPAQVEMKQDIRKPINNSFNLDSNKLEDQNTSKFFQDDEKFRLEQLENVEKRRNTIDKRDYRP